MTKAREEKNMVAAQKKVSEKGMELRSPNTPPYLPCLK
jgi:hypothetical protein